MSAAKNILALDVGDSRVGVASANTIARLPRPVAIVDNDPQVFESLKTLFKEHQASVIVVGLPRNMAGEETQQSKVSRQFAERLKSETDLPIVFADESLSTKRAEESRFMDNKRIRGKHLDDIAACFILEEYLQRSSE